MKSELARARVFILPLICLTLPGAAVAQGQLSSSSQATSQPGKASIGHSQPYLTSVHELGHTVPKKAKSECQNGEKAWRQGRTDEAIRHFEQAVAIDSEFVAARNNLAVTYMATDKVDLAIGQLEQAVKIDPHNPLLFSNLAIGHLLVHDLEAGERAARESIHLNRMSIEAHALLGLTLIKEEKFTDETVRSLEVARDYHPTIRIYLANALIRRGNLSQAASELEAYLASGDTECLAEATKSLNSLNEFQRSQSASEPQHNASRWDE